MNNFTNSELEEMGLKCKLISQMDRPGTISYAAAIQDYSEDNPFSTMFEPVEDGLEDVLGPCREIRDPKNPGKCLSETEAQKRLIDICLKHKHWGPLEHPQIVVNFIGYPHSMLQQLRTHRTGISFDVQSGRYTGQRILDVVEGKRDIRSVFWIRPEGVYQDKGKRIVWNKELIDLAEYKAYRRSQEYARDIEKGMPKEMARDINITYGVRQNFLMSCNLRTAFHLLDMRYKGDAEIEIQWAMQQFLEILNNWAPLIVDFYLDTRVRKNQIAP